MYQSTYVALLFFLDWRVRKPLHRLYEYRFKIYRAGRAANYISVVDVRFKIHNQKNGFIIPAMIPERFGTTY